MILDLKEFLDSISELNLSERIFEILAWSAFWTDGQNVDELHKAIMETIDLKEHHLHTTYSSFTPDGKLCTESRNLQEVIDQAGKRTDLEFAKTEFYKRYEWKPLDIPFAFPAEVDVGVNR